MDAIHKIYGDSCSGYERASESEKRKEQEFIYKQK